MVFVLMNFDFEVFLDFVGKFHARSGKQLHSIVVERIVRGGNHHAGREFFLPHQAGNARSADHSGGKENHAIIGKSGGELRGNVRTRFPRVHADQDARLGVNLQQIFSQRPRDPVQSGVVQRIRAGNAANAVRAEQFLGHRGVRTRRGTQLKRSKFALEFSSLAQRSVIRREEEVRGAAQE